MPSAGRAKHRGCAHHRKVSFRAGTAVGSMTGVASTVHGKTFASGKKLEEHAKQLMHAVGSTRDLKAADPVAFRFMWDLFQRHPRPQEKKLESVRRVAIGPSEQHPARLAMWLMYEDDSPRAISLSACCFPKQKRYQEERALDDWRHRFSPKFLGSAFADDV